MHKHTQRLAWSGLGSIVLLFSIWHFMATGATHSNTLSAHTPLAPLSRPADPVVVMGSHIPDMLGADISELALYTWMDNMWQPIPFQIDEVTITGTYTVFEDGILGIQAAKSVGMKVVDVNDYFEINFEG